MPNYYSRSIHQDTLSISILHNLVGNSPGAVLGLLLNILKSGITLGVVYN